MLKFILLFLFTFFYSTYTNSQEKKDSINNPCKDKLYLELQKKNLDSLSQREYDYFIEMVKQCNNYTKAKKEIETDSGAVVGIVLSVIGGIIAVWLVLAAISNASK